MDGYTTTRHIRQMSEPWCRLPIIALTANAIIGNESMFLNKGFQAFLSKPIEVSRLDAIIRQWVRDKEQEKLLLEQQTESGGTENAPSDEQKRDTAPKNTLNRRALFAGIAGLDIDKGIERFEDEEIYFDALRSYTKHIPSVLKKIEEIPENNLNDYEVLVHGVKGSSQSINADTLGDLAAALEDAAKTGNNDYIRAHHTPFLETARTLLSELDKTFSQTSLKEPRSQKEKPDREVLAALLTACKNFDMDGVDAAVAELRGYEYESESELVSAILEHAEQFDFAQMIEKLEKVVR
jgi:CheY-like chemotaxis protein